MKFNDKVLRQSFKLTMGSCETGRADTSVSLSALIAVAFMVQVNLSSTIHEID